MNSKSRLHYFDMAKGIGIFLVILGHLQGEYFFSLSPIFSPLCVWIFSFHMPLFFIISGMLINYKNDTEKNLKTLIFKRFKSIGVPYLWFSLFYFLAVVFAYIKGNIGIDTLLTQGLYVLSLYGMSVLWFLPALFMGEILFLFLIKKFGGKVTAIIITALTTLAEMLNLLLKNAPQRLCELLTTFIRPIFVCSFVALGYLIFSFFKNQEKYSIKELVLGVAMIAANVFLHKLNGSVDFRSLVFGNILLYYVCALLGSVGLILLCKNIPNIKPISAFGASSLIVMAVHNNETVLFYSMKLAMYINQFVTRARGYICYLVIVLAILVFCDIMMYLINHFFGFIIGKPSPFDRIFKKNRLKNETEKH